jgi:hypothetical protein
MTRVKLINGKRPRLGLATSWGRAIRCVFLGERHIVNAMGHLSNGTLLRRTAPPAFEERSRQGRRASLPARKLARRHNWRRGQTFLRTQSTKDGERKARELGKRGLRRPRERRVGGRSPTGLSRSMNGDLRFGAVITGFDAAEIRHRPPTREARSAGWR